MNPVSVEWRGGRIDVSKSHVIIADQAGRTVSFPNDMLIDFKEAVISALDQAIGDGWFDPQAGPFRSEADE